MEARVDLHRKNRRRPTISRRMCAQSEQRSADGGGGPQRRGGVRMQRSFPPRFYRERRDILTLSVPSKKGAFMHDRARMRDGERMDRERTGWKRHRAPWGVSIEGWLGVTSTLYTIGPNSRMHAYTGKTSNQRPSSTRSGMKSLTFAFQKPAF